MSERVTAIKTAMDAKLSLNPDVDIFPTKATVHDVGGATDYKVLIYETMENRSDGYYKYYTFGCHLKSTTAAKIDDLIEDILRMDSRSVHTSIRYTGTTLLRIQVTKFYPIVSTDSYEAMINLEGVWLV